MVQITKINRDVTNFIYGYIDFQNIILYMQSCAVFKYPAPPNQFGGSRQARGRRRYAHSQIYQSLGQLTMMRGKDKDNAALFL
jgi:hypothetical protein